MKKAMWFDNRHFIQSSSQYIKGDVVDVGCGTTKYKNLILDFEGVNSYTGIDFFQTTHTDVIVDLNKKISIESNKFNSAICISVIEHLYEPQVALNEINRILKPGGYLILSTPWIYPYHGEPDDYFRYSKKALEYMFKKAGFEIVQIVPTGGKLRIIQVILNLWFPRMKKILVLFNSFLVNLYEKSNKEHLNTVSHHVIALKK